MDESCHGMLLCATRKAADVLARDASLGMAGSTVHLVAASTLSVSQRKAMQRVRRCVHSRAATAAPTSLAMFCPSHASTAVTSHPRFALLPSRLLHHRDDAQPQHTMCRLCIDLDMVLVHDCEEGSMSASARNVRQASQQQLCIATLEQCLYARYHHLTQSDTFAAQSADVPCSGITSCPTPATIQHVLVLALDEHDTKAGRYALPTLPALVHPLATHPASTDTQAHCAAFMPRIYRYPLGVQLHLDATRARDGGEARCPSWLLLPPSRPPSMGTERSGVQGGDGASGRPGDMPTDKPCARTARSASGTHPCVCTLCCDYLFVSMYFGTWCEPCDFTWQPLGRTEAADMLGAVIRVALAPSVAAAAAVHGDNEPATEALRAEARLLRRAIAAVEAEEKGIGQHRQTTTGPTRRRCGRAEDAGNGRDAVCEEVFCDFACTTAAGVRSDMDADLGVATALRAVDWTRVARQGWRGLYDSCGALKGADAWEDRRRVQERVAWHMDRLYVQDMHARLTSTKCAATEWRDEWRGLRCAYRVALLLPSPASAVAQVGDSLFAMGANQDAPRLSTGWQRGTLATPAVSLPCLLRDAKLTNGQLHAAPCDVRQAAELADLVVVAGDKGAHAATFNDTRQGSCERCTRDCAVSSPAAVLGRCVADAVHALCCCDDDDVDCRGGDGNVDGDAVSETGVVGRTGAPLPLAPQHTTRVCVRGGEGCVPSRRAALDRVGRHETDVRRLGRLTSAYCRTARRSTPGHKRHHVGVALRRLWRRVATEVSKNSAPSSAIDSSINDDCKNHPDSFSTQHGTTFASAFAQVLGGCDDDAATPRTAYHSLCWAQARLLCSTTLQTKAPVHNTHTMRAIRAGLTPSSDDAPIGAVHMGWLRHAVFLLSRCGDLDEGWCAGGTLVVSRADSPTTLFTQHCQSVSLHHVQQALPLFRAANAHLLAFDETIAAVCTAIQHHCTNTMSGAVS